MTNTVALMARTTERENLRIRLDDETKTAFQDLLARKNLSQQDAILSMIRWLLTQDDLVQSLVCGQIGYQPDLEDLIIKKLKTPAKTSRIGPDRMTTSIRANQR